MDAKHYKITSEEGAEREFTQSAPVPAQLKQLAALAVSIEFDWNELDLIKLLDVLTKTDVASKFLSIILKEKNTLLKDKDLAELTEFFEFNAPLEFIVEAITDFFTLSNISKLLGEGSLKKVAQTLREKLPVQ